MRFGGWAGKMMAWYSPCEFAGRRWGETWFAVLRQSDGRVFGSVLEKGGVRRFSVCRSRARGGDLALSPLDGGNLGEVVEAFWTAVPGQFSQLGASGKKKREADSAAYRRRIKQAESLLASKTENQV